jgi:hypothetical protein
VLVRRWKRIALVALLALTIWLACVIRNIYHHAYVTVPDAYSAWWVAGLVIEYMDSHDGKWPKSWNDLQGPYELATKKFGQPWKFEDLQRRVEVDWNADPSVLVHVKPAGDLPPFHVIWLRDGSNVHWEGREPNRMIWDYLQKKQHDK